MKMKIHRKRKVQNFLIKRLDFSCLDGHLPRESATDIASTICENSISFFSRDTKCKQQVFDKIGKADVCLGQQQKTYDRFF